MSTEEEKAYCRNTGSNPVPVAALSTKRSSKVHNSTPETREASRVF